MDRRMHRHCVVGLAALFCLAGVAQADQVKLNVALGHPVLEANKRQTTYLKVSLTGFTFERHGERPPVNAAIVLDQSGSMQGEKLRKAKEAALMALDRLSRKDIVSVVAYSSTVNVLVPATRLTDKASVREGIRRIQAGGSTALFAGVSKGGDELRKFIERERVNQLILLSDGLANVGPSTPAELGQLGASLVREGISCTTIGLGMGYNEDLMSRLAERSDGNHHFAENASDLARIFKRELGDVLSVVAQEVVVKVRFADGIRPVRVLGREADIRGQHLTAMMNQLFSEQEKYLLVEIEVPATPAGQTRPIASVNVTYANMQTRTTDELESSISARFSSSPELVRKEANRDVMIAAVEQIGVENNIVAVKLRDEGKVKEARRMLDMNRAFLQSNSAQYRSMKLEAQAAQQVEDADNLEGAKWDRQRKSMREYQYKLKQQRR